MKTTKIRIEPISEKEALKRDKRALDFLTEKARVHENFYSGNYRETLDEVKHSINSINAVI